MSSYLIAFWNQIISVFCLNGNFLSVTYYQPYGDVAVDSSFDFSLNISRVSTLLAFLTITGLCVFLFYQVFKLVHAFVGGFYE